MKSQTSLNLKSDPKYVPKAKSPKPKEYPFGNIHHMPYATGEDKLANRVALELKTLNQEKKLNCIWFHVPNETMVKTKHDFALLKKKQCMGMISGVPDFVFIRGSDSFTLLVELKTNKGKLSDNQKSFQKWAENNNTPYEISRSWNDLKISLLKHNLVAK